MISERKLMITLYDKQETADQTLFEFHFLPLANLLFFLAVLVALAPGCKATNRVLRRCVFLLILWIVGVLPAAFEIDEAMRKGPVIVSGSKFSLTNPLKIVIPKA
jgi:uncharacterized membrane protein YoaK (UPF0700 family)